MITQILPFQENQQMRKLSLCKFKIKFSCIFRERRRPSKLLKLKTIREISRERLKMNKDGTKLLSQNRVNKFCELYKKSIGQDSAANHNSSRNSNNKKKEFRSTRNSKITYDNNFFRKFTNLIGSDGNFYIYISFEIHIILDDEKKSDEENKGFISKIKDNLDRIKENRTKTDTKAVKRSSNLHMDISGISS